MIYPVKYTAREIKNWNCYWDIHELNNSAPEHWIPARDIRPNYFGFIHRIKLAFFVLIGKYDVLDWEDHYGK